MHMGKDLKGKELGEGVDQRKDGKYRARYRSVTGKRPEKLFSKLYDAKLWILEQKKKDSKERTIVDSNTTVNEWYDYWIKNIKGSTIRAGTIHNYDNWYNHCRKEIGRMKLEDVKPMHCQKILNDASEKGLSKCSVTSIRKIMVSIFYSAEENELINKSPVTKNVKAPDTEPEEKVKAMEKEIQNKFLMAASKYYQYYLFAFTLQTGLRSGEVCGLKWEDIDFKKKILTVRRSVHYDGKNGYIISQPKTKAGCREIPLTQEAINLLISMKDDLKDLYVNPDFKDFIFHNENGNLCWDTALNRTLKLIAKRANIPYFSMHCLRHTFATRCIEAGMRPKTLQKILGHSSINITMNLYVHVTPKELHAEINKFEQQFDTYRVGVFVGDKAKKCFNRAHGIR